MDKKTVKVSRLVSGDGRVSRRVTIPSKILKSSKEIEEAKEVCIIGLKDALLVVPENDVLCSKSRYLQESAQRIMDRCLKFCRNLEDNEAVITQLIGDMPRDELGSVGKVFGVNIKDKG